MSIEKHSFSAISFIAAGSLGQKVKKLTISRTDDQLQIDLALKDYAGSVLAELSLDKRDAIEFADWILEEFTGGE